MLFMNTINIVDDIPELKCCPFCGGKAKYENYFNISPVIEGDSGAYVDADLDYYETVYCVKCGAQIFDHDDNHEEGYTIKLWNTRCE